MRLVGSMLLVTLLSLGLGCNSFRVTNGATDIRGNIVSIRWADKQSQETGIIGSILIKGTIEKDTKFDKASVTIRDKTRIFEQKDGADGRGHSRLSRLGRRCRRDSQDP